MACSLVATTGGGCGRGGVLAVYSAPIEDIASYTVSGGVVTAITMASGKRFFKYTPDDENDVATFNIIQDAPRAKHVATGLISVNGVDANKVAVARGFDSCCGIVSVWYLGSGVAYVQGVVLDSDTAVVTSVGRARARTSILSDTAANDSRTEIEIISSDLRMVPTTDLTASAVEALVGS